MRDVRGVGLMVGVELDSAERAKADRQGPARKGIIINRTHETVLRFLPPFIMHAGEARGCSGERRWTNC